MYFELQKTTFGQLKNSLVTNRDVNSTVAKTIMSGALGNFWRLIDELSPNQLDWAINLTCQSKKGKPRGGAKRTYRGAVELLSISGLSRLNVSVWEITWIQSISSAIALSIDYFQVIPQISTLTYT